MKICKSLFSVFLFFAFHLAFCQNNIIKNRILVGGGWSLYPNMKYNNNNYNLYFSYFLNQRSRWAWEFQFSYSQDNFFPDFYGNVSDTDRYILSRNAATALDDVNWESVRTQNIGAKIHFKFLEKNKLMLSVNCGIFVKKSTERKYFLTKIYVLESDPSDVVGYNYINYEGGTYGIDAKLGIHFEHDIGTKFLVAIDAGYNKNLESKINSYNDNYFFTSLGIGYKF